MESHQRGCGHLICQPRYPSGTFLNQACHGILLSIVIVKTLQWHYEHLLIISCIRHPNIIGSHIISFSEVLIQRYLYITEQRLFWLHLRTLRDHNSRSFGGDNLGLDEQQCMFDHIRATTEGEGRPFR